MSKAIQILLPLALGGHVARVHAQTVDEYRELMIVHPSVVDPYLNGGRSHNGGPNVVGGAWSLPYLLRAATISLPTTRREEFYASLFEQWLDIRTADNGATIPARDAARVRQLMLDQFSSVDATGKRTFQMWKAPFELMAIVYRPDLRAANGSDGGELRFVYKLVGPLGEDLEATMNVEYKVRTSEMLSNLTWVNNFHRLGSLEIGSEEYLQLLERLTGFHVPTLGGVSPLLSQIRTNELAFVSEQPWEMREFVLNRINFFQALMLASSVENTPAAQFNDTQVLADFIAQNPVLAEAGTAFMNFKLPEVLNGQTFLAGSSLAGAGGVNWIVPGEEHATRSTAVDNLGTLTCNGCHQENKAAGDMAFYHIKPNISPGEDGRPRLSLFLTQADPARPDSRPGELNRRKADFSQLLSQPWTPTWITP